MADHHDWLTSAEVSERIGRDRRFVVSLAREGLLEGATKQANGEWRIPDSAVARWLSANPGPEDDAESAWQRFTGWTTQWRVESRVSFWATVLSGLGGLIAVATLIFSGGDSGPDDTALELVEAEYGDTPMVIPLGMDQAEFEDLSAQFGWDSRRSRDFGVTITLRNPTEFPIVITSIQLTVDWQAEMRFCGVGVGGGGFRPPYVYDFRVPRDVRAWESTNEVNFSVGAKDTTTVVVSIGPDTNEHSFQLASYTVSAGTRDGYVYKWARGLTVDTSDSLLEEHIADVNSGIFPRQVLLILSVLPRSWSMSTVHCLRKGPVT